MWAGVGRVWRVCGAVVTGRLERRRRELQSDSVFGIALRICYLAWYYSKLCGPFHQIPHRSNGAHHMGGAQRFKITVVVGFARTSDMHTVIIGRAAAFA